MTLPGFGGDEIKSYRKPLTNDVHKERLAAVRKSIVATETATKTSAGQASGHTKGHLAKTPASSLATQNQKFKKYVEAFIDAADRRAIFFIF